MAGIYLSIPEAIEFKDAAMTYLKQARDLQDPQDAMVAAQMASAYATLYSAGVLQDILRDMKDALAVLARDSMELDEEDLP